MNTDIWQKCNFFFTILPSRNKLYKCKFK